MTCATCQRRLLTSNGIHCAICRRAVDREQLQARRLKARGNYDNRYHPADISPALIDALFERAKAEKRASRCQL